MLKNFLKLALRSMWKQKGYSFLNIFGLALGMACSILILLWIRDEKSTDNYHVNGDRLYSIYERQYYDGKISAFFGSPGILSDELKKVLPEVEMASAFNWSSKATFQVGDKILKEEGRDAGADLKLEDAANLDAPPVGADDAVGADRGGDDAEVLIGAGR